MKKIAPFLVVLLFSIFGFAQQETTSMTISGDDAVGPVITNLQVNVSQTPVQQNMNPFTVTGSNSIVLNNPSSVSSISMEYVSGRDVRGISNGTDPTVHFDILFPNENENKVELVVTFHESIEIVTVPFSTDYVLPAGTIITVSNSTFIPNPLESCLVYCSYSMQFTLNP